MVARWAGPSELYVEKAATLLVELTLTEGLASFIVV